MGDKSNRSVSIGGNVDKGVIVTGDRNRSQLVIQTTLPPEGVNLKEFLILRSDAALKGSPYAESRSTNVTDRIEITELDESELVELKQDPGIEVVAPAMPLSLIKPLEEGGEGALLNGDMTWGVHAVKAHECPFDGSGVVVAVLDTGIDAGHECFQGIDFIVRDFTGTGAEDTNGHGTHCTGTIVGRNAQGTRFSVAPGIQKVVIGKVLGGEHGGSTATLHSAIQWAIGQGAHVISMSLGIDFPGYVAHLVEVKGWPADFATSVALEAYCSTIRFFDHLSALVKVQERAALIVAAAGNESRPTYQINVAPPAAADGFLSVAAVEKLNDGSLRTAVFSNTGAKVAGPGVDITSTRAGGGYTKLSGTSMATPHVAGVAALWAQGLVAQHGILDIDLLWSKLRSSARLNGLRSASVGAGIVQAPLPEDF